VKRAAAAVLGILLLGGCAPALRAPEPGVRVDAAILQHWTASGRLALAADGEGGSGSFVWNQREGVTELDIRGPLGAGALQIIAIGESLSVADGAGRTLDPDAARAHLQARLGADVPWGQLRYWMLGVPSPDAPAQVSEAGASPWRVIEQSGWRIGYDAFVTTVSGSLPQRFTASRQAVRVKVIVDTWAVPSDVPPTGGGTH
jgi:outer membrane lipoprotein LolB